MRRITNHAKSGLFLIEMIMCLLFLGLCCAVCLRLFAAAYLLREEARTNNHIQEIMITASEILEGWSGDPDSFLEELSRSELIVVSSWNEDSRQEKDSGSDSSFTGSFETFYDRKWNPSSKEDAVYQFDAALRLTELEKTLELSFSRPGTEEEETLPFYQSAVSFPAFG